MNLHPVRLVTLSREFGSGGSDLAQALGRRLGWRVVDKEVVRRVARTLQLPEEAVEARDEAAPRLGERLGELLAGAFPELVPPTGMPVPDYEAVAELSEAILRDAAANPPVICVGHGGMCLFEGTPGALHVRVTAPRPYRVAQVMSRLGMSRGEAEEEVRVRDDARREHIRHRFDREITDPGLYAVVVNSERIPPEDGATLLAALIRRA